MTLQDVPEKLCTVHPAQGLPLAIKSLHQRLFWHAGTIPPELEGTLLRNGPALFDIGGASVNQPFDGDGMVRFPA